MFLFSFQLKIVGLKTLSNIYVLTIVWILFIWGRYCDCCATNIAMLVPVSVSQLARYYHEDRSMNQELRKIYQHEMYKLPRKTLQYFIVRSQIKTQN